MVFEIGSRILLIIDLLLWIYLIYCLFKARTNYRVSKNGILEYLSPHFIIPKFHKTSIGSKWADRFWKTLIAIVLLHIVAFVLYFIYENV